ncbi:hypothetical protein [Serpens gallinarum]|uniref:Uncharacterized protein n=1 Tax=Serpens gallinarum TaxID=2763075 RepID=A0ABR8TLN7_9PSED|nr:hypothetical protein [Serpens gallinarum]MBD7976681.1 hypothetical protein [Serpens gallinarum]
MNRSAFSPAQIPLGLVIWSLWFVAVYGAQGLGCELAPPSPQAGATTWLNAALGLFTALTLALLLLLAWRFWRLAAATAAQRFVARLSAGVHLVAALATAFIGLPLLSLPPCL